MQIQFVHFKWIKRLKWIVKYWLQPPNSQRKTYYLPKIVKFCTYIDLMIHINNSYQIPTTCLNHCWDDNEIITAVWYFNYVFKKNKISVGQCILLILYFRCDVNTQNKQSWHSTGSWHWICSKTIWYVLKIFTTI